jgi:methyl coenzyme M reductase subunit D
MPTIGLYELHSIPFKNIDFNNSEEKSTHDEIVSLVDSMLSLNKELQSANLPQKQEQLKNRIEYTNKKIDELIYKLYGLTEEEIKIVEGTDK